MAVELDADTILREKIRARDKALRDYESEIATARLEGREEGRAEGRVAERAAIAEVMRRNGFTEEQIRLALGK